MQPSVNSTRPQSLPVLALGGAGAPFCEQGPKERAQSALRILLLGEYNFRLYLDQFDV